MDAIETLMNEHRMIERALDALVAFADEVQRQASTKKEELARFVTFVREFADAGHHGKEEEILFQAMAACGFPNEDGPIGVMLREHDQGRALVGILGERAEQSAPWSDGDRRQVAETAHAFSEFLRSHIQKEDEILYPMAQGHLTPEACKSVDEACARFDASRVQSGVANRLHALGDELLRGHATEASVSDD